MTPAQLFPGQARGLTTPHFRGTLVLRPPSGPHGRGTSHGANPGATHTSPSSQPPLRGRGCLSGPRSPRPTFPSPESPGTPSPESPGSPTTPESPGGASALFGSRGAFSAHTTEIAPHSPSEPYGTAAHRTGPAQPPPRDRAAREEPTRGATHGPDRADETPATAWGLGSAAPRESTAGPGEIGRRPMSREARPSGGPGVVPPGKHCGPRRNRPAANEQGSPPLGGSGGSSPREKHCGPRRNSARAANEQGSPLRLGYQDSNLD